MKYFVLALLAVSVAADDKATKDAPPAKDGGAAGAGGPVGRSGLHGACPWCPPDRLPTPRVPFLGPFFIIYPCRWCSPVFTGLGVPPLSSIANLFEISGTGTTSAPGLPTQAL